MHQNFNTYKNVRSETCFVLPYQMFGMELRFSALIIICPAFARFREIRLDSSIFVVCFGNNFKRVEEVRTNDRFDDFFFCFCFDFCFCCRSHHFFLSWSQSPHSSAKVWSGTCHSHQHWGSWIWLRASRASFVVFLFFCGLQSFFEADGCNTGTSLRWVCF